MEQLGQPILIIGAGVAGLMAARSLARAGHNVVVLEARDRIGGRIFTHHLVLPGETRPLAVELGAEFIHGLPEETWALVREAGWAAFELAGTHVQIPDPAAMADGTSVLQQMAEWAAARAGTDLSFAEFLAVAGLGERGVQAMRYVEGFNAAESSRISVAALLRQQQAEDSIQAERLFRLREGYDQLPHWLASGLNQAGGQIALRHRVHGIAWTPGSVSVRGDGPDGRPFDIRARRVLVTVPLGVLQRETIAFSPPPEQALVQARRLAMGSVIRLTLVFRSRVWRQWRPELGELSFLFGSDEMPGTWWTAAPDPAPTVTGWVGGAPQVAAAEARAGARGGHALLQLYLESFARLLGVPARDLAAQLVGWHMHDWQGDEFSLGAYSYVPVGAIDASNRMAEPVADTLYFAGEHTDTTGHWGTVHGALRSGLRAAAQISAADSSPLR